MKTSKFARRAKSVMRPVVLTVGLLALWALASHVLGLPHYLIPPPELVVKQLVTQWPKLFEATSVTTAAAVGGFALSVAVGLPVAMLIAYSRTIESYLYPVLVLSQSVPKIAIAPLFVVWFGFGILPKVISAFLLGVFPVIVATVTGLKSVEPEMLDLARSVRATRLKIFWYISLPHSLPHIFSGLKVAVTLAVVGAVVGEFVGSNSGIGYVLQIANGNFDLPLMFAALLLLSLVGVILFALVEVAEAFLVPWHSSRRIEFQATA